MIEKHEISVLMQAVGRVVKSHVAGVVSAIAKRIDELDARLKAIPAGAKGDSGTAAEIDYGRVGDLVTATVATAVAALPVPVPGKDADPVTVRELVDAEVVKAVAALPKPQDGKSVDLEKTAAYIRSEVRSAVSELPPAPKGKDADPVDVAAIIAEVSAKIPAPIAGKDADPEFVRAEVARVVAALPVPQNGKDADMDAVRALIAAAVAAMPPAKPGEPGKDATPIHPDTVALMVRDAVDKAVAALPPAKDGAPGRDAAELIVLPDIDETRSYPAGTYANHRGGEIRAERRTDPVKDGDVLAAGWTVSREGIAGVVITQSEADPREIHVAAMLTDGTKAVATFSIPMVLDSGVWREGAYQQGDHVSWDGSGWIAQRATTDKPGTSDGFRLATKRGRDGRDGKDAETASPKHAPTVRLK